MLEETKRADKVLVAYPNDISHLPPFYISLYLPPPPPNFLPNQKTRRQKEKLKGTTRKTSHFLTLFQSPVPSVGYVAPSSPLMVVAYPSLVSAAACPIHSWSRRSLWPSERRNPSATWRRRSGLWEQRLKRWRYETCYLWGGWGMLSATSRVVCVCGWVVRRVESRASEVYSVGVGNGIVRRGAGG